MDIDHLSSASGIALIPSIVISFSAGFSLGGGALVWACLTLTVYLAIESNENIKNQESIERRNSEVRAVQDENLNNESSNFRLENSEKSIVIEKVSTSKTDRGMLDIDMSRILALPELAEILHFFRAGEKTEWLTISWFRYGDIGTFKAEYVALEAASMYIRIHLENRCSIKEVEGLLNQKRYEIEDIIKTALPDYEHAEKAALELYLRASRNGDILKPCYCI